MEQSLVKNKWNEILDQADDWWEELTHDDMEQINGSHAQLVYVLQERYDYSHEAAKAEVEKRVGSLVGHSRHEPGKGAYPHLTTKPQASTPAHR